MARLKTRFLFAMNCTNVLDLAPAVAFLQIRFPYRESKICSQHQKRKVKTQSRTHAHGKFLQEVLENCARVYQGCLSATRCFRHRQIRPLYDIINLRSVLCTEF
jgi:hypothetical protein